MLLPILLQPISPQAYGQGDDRSSSDRFYHWGALLGFMALLEEDVDMK